MVFVKLILFAAVLFLLFDTHAELFKRVNTVKLQLSVSGLSFSF